MYKNTMKSQLVNAFFLALLLFLAIYVPGEIMYRIVILLVAIFVLRDTYREWLVRYDVTGKSINVYMKGKLVKEVKYSDVKYITITRKNRKWTVIANDEGILFVVKPKIENYEAMVGDILRLTQSNKKIEAHDYIKKVYKR